MPIIISISNIRNASIHRWIKTKEEKKRKRKGYQSGPSICSSECFRLRAHHAFAFMFHTEILSWSRFSPQRPAQPRLRRYSVSSQGRERERKHGLVLCASRHRDRAVDVDEPYLSCAEASPDRLREWRSDDRRPRCVTSRMPARSQSSPIQPKHPPCSLQCACLVV